MTLLRWYARLGVQISLAGVLVCALQCSDSNRAAGAQQQGPGSTTRDGKSNITDVEYRAGEIHAHPWHETLGRLSQDDVLRLPPGSLWNTPFGPDASPSSRATLIVVEVTGPPDGSASRRMLEFSATARLLDGRRSLLLRKSVRIAGLNAQGRYYVPFLLHDTGCVPIELHAEIRGQRSDASLNRLLDFRCGE